MGFASFFFTEKKMGLNWWGWAGLDGMWSAQVFGWAGGDGQ